jgi:hypothetical protein
MPRVVLWGNVVAAGVLVAEAPGCGSRPGVPGPKPSGQSTERRADADRARLATPFADRLSCNIVAINALESCGGKVMYCWTDGVASSRANTPIDLYIDTNDAIDWTRPAAECIVSLEVRSPTRMIESTYTVMGGKLRSRIAGRGLVAFENVYRINPVAHVVHDAGEHRIAIEVEVEQERLTGFCTFSIR